MADKIQANKLREISAAIASAQLITLLEPKDAGSFSFEEHRDLFKTVLDFYSQFPLLDLAALPSSILEQGISNADAVFRAIGQIRDFNARSGDPNQMSPQLVKALTSAYNTAYANFAVHIAYARTATSTVAAELSSLRSEANTIRNERAQIAQNYADRVASLEAEQKARTTEIEKVLAAAREASKLEAVSAQASEFHKEAASTLTASWWWLAGTILSVIISLLVVWYSFLKPANDSPTGAQPTSAQQPTLQQGQGGSPPAKPTSPTPSISSDNKQLTAVLLQQTVARVLIITLLYSIVAWCARNFFACRHNYTVNRHRRNAMKTFRAFVEGTKDIATQDFILRQAAACAFSPQQSGYLKDESLPPPAPASQFIDIVKPDAR
jgi:hypothetical protein